MQNILIGGAWPYANGSLHIGHIAALLPGDVLARYYRAKGDQVFYVSGSDCHGTPVTIRAQKTGQTAQEISDLYHAEFVDVFARLGFSYDLYSKTSSRQHKEFVRNFHEQLYQSAYIYAREVKQAFCPTCQKAVTDRQLIGSCPNCGAGTRGDQCEACAELIETETLLWPSCADCGSKLDFTIGKELFLALSKLQAELTNYLKAHPGWRKNVQAFTKRYLDEGLRDRAITRRLDWGVPVPRAGYQDKRIYIWAENVLGYLSASQALCQQKKLDFLELWTQPARHYYVHGKDNIPFHTLILPGLLLSHEGGYRLPDDIIASEYLTLEGKKISTSQNWAVWAKDIIKDYNPDAIRYFLLANGPEKRDTDFSWREFFERNNSELVGAYGNLVNRTLVFIHKYQAGVIPAGCLEKENENLIASSFTRVGQCLEEGQFKDALSLIFALIRQGNKYYDIEKPWLTRKDNPPKCQQTIYNCVQIIANLAVLLQPFLPFSSRKIFSWLELNDKWQIQAVRPGRLLPENQILFGKLEKSIIGDEIKKIGS